MTGVPGEVAATGATAEQPAWSAGALLLTRADSPTTRRWALDGLLPVRLVPLEGWTAVVPAGPSLAGPPYDAVPDVLLSRPLSRGLRPAIGLWVVGERAVVTVHLKGSRVPVKWLVRDPVTGMEPAPVLARTGLTPGSARDLARAAADPQTVPALAALLADPPAGEPVEFLQAVLETLHLPGLRLLIGGEQAYRSDAEVVRPSARQVRRFESTTAEERRVSAELRGTR